MSTLLDADLINVLVQNPESPFGGVIVDLPDTPLVVELSSTPVPVKSVFGRIGDIIALSGDYSAFYAPLGGQIPHGGTVNQVLTKNSSADQDASWQNAPGGTFANPTASVGLTAVNGSGTNAMRANAAPALDVSIAPTWSGLHTFSLSPIVPTPTTNFQAATKKYVDDSIPPAGGDVFKNAANTFGASGTLDLTATAVTAGLTLPSGASATPTAAGVLAYDTSNTVLRYGVGGTARTVASRSGNETLQNKTLDNTNSMSGFMIVEEIAAPTNAPANAIRMYADSTDLRFHDKNTSGVIGTTVVADTGAANNFLTAISTAGVISKAQPTPTNVGLGNVTNDVQTKAAIVPNTAPSAGQILAGNAGGTAYAPVTLSGSGATATLSSAGVLTLSAIPLTTLSASTTLAIGVGTIELGHATDTTISRVSAGVIAVEGVNVILSGGALGTPSSGTLTSCTGLPIAGLTASTSTALGVGSIELGHATDTTIARSGAGAITVEGVQVLLSGAALGTPSSGTLTNCTGLPIAGLTASTSTALGVGSIELGHATDTTIARVGAGQISVEGVNVVTTSSTDTLTNKRVTKRTGSTTSSATPTINTDNVDMYLLTAQAVDITSFTTNLSGTPTEGQTLWISITGTAARAITWGTSFEASTVALPTTTVTTARLDVGFVWNTVSTKWRCVAVA